MHTASHILSLSFALSLREHRLARRTSTKGPELIRFSLQTNNHFHSFNQFIYNFPVRFVPPARFFFCTINSTRPRCDGRKTIEGTGTYNIIITAVVDVVGPGVAVSILFDCHCHPWRSLGSVAVVSTSIIIAIADDVDSDSDSGKQQAFDLLSFVLRVGMICLAIFPLFSLVHSFFRSLSLVSEIKIHPGGVQTSDDQLNIIGGRCL